MIINMLLTLTLGFGVISSTAWALENAQVLPAGARRLNLTSVHLKFNEKTNSSGDAVNAADKLEKDVTYGDFAKSREGSDRTQLEAFLKTYDLNPKDVVGSIAAELKANVDVYVPSFAFGFTDRFTLGVGIPYYKAQTDTAISFNPGSSADDFTAFLASDRVGMRGRAVEATDSINDVSGSLDEKLEKNGYEKLGYWENSGVGDIIVKGKYLALKAPYHRGSLELGFVMPTGQTDDPDVLTDIPFGDGSWDITAGGMYDYLFSGTPFFLNTFGRYTAQLPAQRVIRMKTAEEKIEVGKELVQYDLGDKIEAGSSLQALTQFGLQGGLGYTFYKKYEDRYDAGESSQFYQEGTQELAHWGEAQLGYSTIPAFRRKTVAVPFTTAITYSKLYKSENMPVSDRVQLDAKVFF